MLNKVPGQKFVLQDSVKLNEPLQVPPCASTTFLCLVFILSPPPQLLLHSPGNHELQTQSTKHIDKMELSYSKKIWRKRDNRSANLSLTWTIMCIAGLGNSWWSGALISSMWSCNIGFSCICLQPSSTRFWTSSNGPIFPDTVDYGSIKFIILCIMLFLELSKYWTFLDKIKISY